MKVEGNYRGRGKWYKGKITRDRGDGTYEISYDDGESETRLKKDVIGLQDEGVRSHCNTPIKTKEGRKSEGNHKGEEKRISVK